MNTLEKYIKLANLLDNLGHYDAAKLVDAWLTKSADASDYLNAAERDVQDIIEQVKRMPLSDDSYFLNKKLQELDYYIKALRNELSYTKHSSLELEMEKEVEVTEDEDDEDGEEKETKKKKITLSFD